MSTVESIFGSLNQCYQKVNTAMDNILANRTHRIALYILGAGVSIVSLYYMPVLTLTTVGVLTAGVIATGVTEGVIKGVTEGISEGITQAQLNPHQGVLKTGQIMRKWLNTFYENCAQYSKQVDTAVKFKLANRTNRIALYILGAGVLIVSLYYEPLPILAGIIVGGMVAWIRPHQGALEAGRKDYVGLHKWLSDLSAPSLLPKSQQSQTKQI